MDFADFLDSDDEKMENNEADASDVSKIYSGDFQSGKEQLVSVFESLYLPIRQMSALNIYKSSLT